jgi:lysozyme family protein
MASENLRRAVAIVFKHEGGYTDNPKDPGNWTGGKIGVGRLVGTNMGIAAPTLAAYRRREVTALDMRTLTRAEADRIISGQYWITAGCDSAPHGCDLSLFDTSVNSGPGRAKAIGRKAGDMRASPVDWIKRYSRERLSFMRGLRAWQTFGRGWSRRVADIEATSIRWAVAALGGSASRTLAEEARNSEAASRKQGTQAATIGTGGAVTGGSATQVEQAASAPLWVWGAVIVIVVVPTAYLAWRAMQQGERAKAMRAEMVQPADEMTGGAID